MRIHQCRYGIYHPNFDRHVYRNLTISETPDEPFSSSHADNSMQYGVLTVDGLTFENIGRGNKMLIPITHYNASGKAVSHFRNVQADRRRPTGGRWRTCTAASGCMPPTPKGVPIYFHDYFGPGRHAKVVSTQAADLLADGNDYREVPPLTGDESRAAEVQDVEFPKLLDPGGRPPARDGHHARVTGRPAASCSSAARPPTTASVQSVVVNGSPHVATAGNFAQWEIQLNGTPPTSSQITAHATDAAGNTELLPHLR